MPSAKPPGLSDPAKRTLSNPIFKDDVIFEKYSCETDNTHFFMTFKLGPRGGNPLHWHTKNDEIFIAGAKGLGVVFDSKEMHLKPNETFTVPRRHNHRFFNPTDEEIMFQVKVEPGNESFEKGLYVAYGLARDGLTDEKGIPKSLIHIAIFMYLTDTWLAGWGPYLMGPLFSVLYAYARWSGEEERLVKEYWG